MSKEQLETIAETVAEARRLNARMTEVLDALDAVLDVAQQLQTDEIDRIQEASHA